MRKIPWSVLLIACLYMIVGVAGFVAHFADLRRDGAFHPDTLLIEVTELLALLCGVFMLRGRDWARWLALAWIAFHIVLSAFQDVRSLIVHCIFCAFIAWAVFRPQATRYFRRA